MNARTDTTRTVPGRVLVAGDTAVPVTVEMRHTLTDPVAAHLIFHHDGTEVPWVLSLDMLDAGRRGDAGLGDVRLWPSSEAGVEVMYLSLSSPEGEALIEVPTGDVTAFVDAAYASMVGRSEELLTECVDTCIADILADAGVE